MSAETRKAAAGAGIMKIDEKHKQMKRTKSVDVGHLSPPTRVSCNGGVGEGSMEISALACSETSPTPLPYCICVSVCVYRAGSLVVYTHTPAHPPPSIDCLFPLLKKRRHLWNEHVNSGPHAPTLTSHGFVITFLPFFSPSGVPQLVLFAFYKKRTKKSIIIQIYPTSC